MRSMQKWMLGAAVAVGTLGLGTTTARAAEFGVYVGGPVAYVPPCPGPGYEWIAGYQADGYWVPGRWNYIGVRVNYGDYGRYDRDRDFRGHDWDHRDDRGHGDDRGRGYDDHRGGGRDFRGR